jgi:ATP-dependent Clp protease ATP-binding subunit ClpC
MKDKIMSELKRTFNPEFLNRVDEAIVFRGLEFRHVRHIADIMLEDLKNRLKNMNLNLDISPDIADMLAKRGYDTTLGARQLRREIQKYIEDPLSEEILRVQPPSGAKVKIFLESGEIKFAIGMLEIEMADVN